MTMLEQDVKVGDPELDKEPGKLAHLVLEKWDKKDGSDISEEDLEKLPTGGNVTEAYVIGTPITALCGVVFVPSRDPTRYPVCRECVDIAQGQGWNTPY